MPKIEVRRRTRLKAESCIFIEFANNNTSQSGEDGIIDKIFKIITPTSKFCVEFGAWDGVHLSNTRTLINDMGWEAVLIEGNEEKFKQLNKNYSKNKNVQTINHFVGFEKHSLDNILARTYTPKDFDLLSIDIDGNDWHVWNSLDNYRPRIVVIEFNPSVPNDTYFVQDKDPSINHGASLLAMIDLGKIKGYELISAMSQNAFFVVKEEFQKFGIEDNDIDAMHDASGFHTKLFQGYDGTIFLAGFKKLLWKGIPFSAEDLQVLPASMRKYFEPATEDKSGLVPAWRPDPRKQA